jgi:hypothetical protein
MVCRVVAGVAAVIPTGPRPRFSISTPWQSITDANAERLALARAHLDARYREHQTTIRPTVDDIPAGGHLLSMTRAGPLDVPGFIGEQRRYEDLLAVSLEIDMRLGLSGFWTGSADLREKAHGMRHGHGVHRAFGGSPASTHPSSGPLADGTCQGSDPGNRGGRACLGIVATGKMAADPNPARIDSCRTAQRRRRGPAA